MMFQDPYASLDPRMRVGAILREPLSIQGVGSRQEQDAARLELLDEVGLPRNAVERYPHEFSGGQRQRIGLARALTLNPKVIVADEPVSALDVSIRSQVLNLMKRLQAEHGLTYVVISHDLAVVKYLADRIGVMYLGKMVELGTGDDIYRRAAHPYTAGLIETIPVPDPGVAQAEARRRASGASCPARSTRRRAAGSAPAARSRRSCAPRRSRCCARSGPATWPPATSRCSPRIYTQLSRRRRALQRGHDQPAERSQVVAALLDHDGGTQRGDQPARLAVAVLGDAQRALRVVRGGVHAQRDHQCVAPGRDTPQSASSAASHPGSPVPGASGTLRLAPSPAPVPARRRSPRSAGTSPHRGRRAPTRRRRPPGRRTSPGCRCRGARPCRRQRPARPRPPAAPAPATAALLR